jgi:hypothetical protein
MDGSRGFWPCLAVMMTAVVARVPAVSMSCTSPLISSSVAFIAICAGRQMPCEHGQGCGTCGCAWGVHPPSRTRNRWLMS